MILFFLSLFCWQQSLHLPSCVIRGFCLLSNAETEDRRYCTGKKNWRFFGFLGETEEVFDVGEFSWRQITHFDILWTISAFKKKMQAKSGSINTTYAATNTQISTHILCQSRASNYHPAERFAVIFVCGYLSSTPQSFWKLQFSWWPMSGSLSCLIFRGR